MRVLTLEDTKRLITMDLCLEALEPAYADAAQGLAGVIPRADLISPHPERAGAFSAFKTMSGSVPRYGVTALRLNSDVVHWPEVGGQLRRSKIPSARGGRWVGLVLLFDMATGEPTAIFPDGHLQRMRVGAAGGLSSKYLADPDSRNLAVYGSGWQAGAQVLAHCAVRPIEQVRVWSPTRENRERFAKEMGLEVPADVVPVETPEEAALGADIVACATNALDHVFVADWLEPHMHLTNVRLHELAPDVYRRCDRIFVHSPRAEPDTYAIGMDPEDLPEQRKGWSHPGYQGFEWTSKPTLADLIAGKVPGRERDEEITSFANNIGLGFQFAAVGAKMVERAEEQEIGHALPIDWFLQDVHP